MGLTCKVSQTRTKEDDHKITMKMGDKDYKVDVSKIPYLASFVQRQKSTRPGATKFFHEPISLFDVALKGIESGYRQCFRSLATDLSQYRTLFETYQLLNVDVLSGLSVNEVIANLKVGKSDFDPDERRPIPGNKSLARDTALQLLYLILHAQLENQTRDNMKLFNAVMFVVSHPGTFKYRTKRIIRIAYDERFIPTIKQRAGLDKWEKRAGTNDEPDATTEEESDYDFDSDYSF